MHLEASPAIAHLKLTQVMPAVAVMKLHQTPASAACTSQSHNLTGKPNIPHPLAVPYT